MSVQLDIQLADDLSESIEEPPSSSLLNAWAQAAWQGDVSAEPVLSLRIVSPAESQQLNNDYRGINKPTNVLSFPMQIDFEPGDVSISNFGAELVAGADPVSEFGSEMMLGDLAICAEIVEHEAQQQKKTNKSHWAHMVVHGMLHLQGFDHVEDKQAEQMESIESRVMQQLGFSDPYLMNNNFIESSTTEPES